MAFSWLSRRRSKGKDATVAEKADKGQEIGEKKKKLTKKEKEQAERALRARLPTRSQVGSNGIFEMTGNLSYTFAVGQIPGGQFIAVQATLQGHTFYVFDGVEGRKPSAKPLAFFNVKRAAVDEIGLLQQDPPLPPHTNVFKLTFNRKQYGHRAYFFKTSSNKELRRWVQDLTWRVKASEAQLVEKSAPKDTGPLLRRRRDETESGIDRQPERLLGMVVRYEQRPAAEEVSDDEDLSKPPTQPPERQNREGTGTRTNQRRQPANSATANPLLQV
mmetsp:Transcript_51186/g.84895  ORF Transcript_51186/g.84895 Transcript_51186/m.84895 type:complete len:274 (-) Transcript_51186:45-866(-)|eukprot:CAMPEP_0119314674 /NCGR_PEP_ID=MMETSP1333-20130426/33669_1 /TAXON_ID=418940 /ORGANISM="Scyphosphaera apsteinii, Strain RCC1455" /LENGTH=273 /DNA_ID=CAMNT_0007319843 /DNA_START=116 /DNA_END=940 /DNA_ORIENTATION=+